jgi:hypothetical protein
MFIRLSFRLLRLLACNQRRSPVQKTAAPHQQKRHPVFSCTCCALVYRGLAFAMIISFVVECFPLQSCRSRARNPTPLPKSLCRHSFPRPLFPASPPPVPAILSHQGSPSPSPVGPRGPREAGLFANKHRIFFYAPPSEYYRIKSGPNMRFMRPILRICA